MCSRIMSWVAAALLAACLPAQAGQRFAEFLGDLQSTPVRLCEAKAQQYLAKQAGIPIIEGENKVHFLVLSEAETVQIEGDVQAAWSKPVPMQRLECGARDLFYVSYTLPADAAIEYRFVVGEARELDANNPKVVQSFDYGDRNLVTMPRFSDTAVVKPRYGIKKGVLNRWLLRTNHARFTNQLIWIYTPQGYTKEKKFPVLFVYDGMWAIHDRPFINVLDNLVHDGKIEPVVVVFISFEDRYNEYVIHSVEHAKWVVEEIVPFIEDNFAVSDSPTRRAVMGASAAGHAAMVAALRHSNVFGNVASQGAGAGGYPGHNPLVNQALDVYLTQSNRYPLRTLYSEVGIYDLAFPDQNATFLAGARQFHDRLQETNVEHVYKEVSGGHTGKVWDQSLQEILMLFFGER